MLVNCPKCGLSQPNDKYCAKCGVDMDSFRPVQPSALKKFLFNPFFHIAIVVSLLASTVLFVRQRQREELKARIEYLNAGPIVVQSETAISPRSQDQSESNSSDSIDPIGNEIDSQGKSISPTANTGENLQAPSSPNGPLPSTQNLTNEAPGNARTGVAKPALRRALMIYAEVDRQIVSNWLSEMRNHPSFKVFDSVSTGIISDVSQKLRTAGVKILQQIEYQIRPPNNHDWFVGTHRGQELENEIGFFSSLLVNDQRDGIIRGEIEVQRAFRDPGDPAKMMERVSFGGVFEMPLGYGFVMRGLLPSRYAMDIEDDLNPDSFLSVLKSRKFVSEETEFIFILDFDSSPSTNK